MVVTFQELFGLQNVLQEEFELLCNSFILSEVSLLEKLKKKLPKVKRLFLENSISRLQIKSFISINKIPLAYENKISPFNKILSPKKILL